MKLNMEKINPIYRDITITKSGVFNENGNDSYESQMLIGGNPTGIANMNTVRHQWAVNIYNTMLANFWIPQTVDRQTISEQKHRSQKIRKPRVS